MPPGIPIAAPLSGFQLLHDLAEHLMPVLVVNDFPFDPLLVKEFPLGLLTHRFPIFLGNNTGCILNEASG